MGDTDMVPPKIIFILHRAFPRVFRHEIRAQSDALLHREYNLAMKNKSLSYAMLHWSIVTHAQARRIADVRNERRLRAAHVAARTLRRS